MVLSEVRFFRTNMVAVRKIILEEVSKREYLIADKELVEDIFGKKEWRINFTMQYPDRISAKAAHVGIIVSALANEEGNVLDLNGSIEKQHLYASRDVSSILGKGI